MLRTSIAGHDDHGVTEVDRAPLGIGQAAIIKELEQGVEDIGMGLLNLVKEDYLVGSAADTLRKLTTLIIADVAWGGANQPTDRMPLLELAHIDTGHGIIAVEHELGQGFGQFGLPNPCWTNEDEATDRAAWITQAAPGTPNRISEGNDRFVLTNHPLVQAILHVHQLLALALEHPAHRYTCPTGDDLGNIFPINDLIEVRCVEPCRSLCIKLRLECQETGAEYRSTLVVATCSCLFLFLLQFA